jgi:hypothetical protein
MMGKLGPRELEMAIPAGEPYVGGIATEHADGTIAVLIWNVKSRNDITPDKNKNIVIHFDDVTPDGTVTHYVIDNQHSNSLTDPAHADLESVPATLRPNPKGGADLQWSASPNSVSLLVLKRK